MTSRPWAHAIALLGAIVVALSAAGAIANETPDMGSQDQHAGPRMTVSTADYVVPAVTLVRDDGKSISLPTEMNDGRPIMLNFIFTSCGSICPLMSQVFAQVERKLGPDSKKIHLMSISTDPEQDTPERLSEYAQKFHAGPEWQHYTGTVDASIAAQQAFNVYRGDKMSHTPVTLLRAAPGQPWRRIDGFATPDELIHEYRQLLASQ